MARTKQTARMSNPNHVAAVAPVTVVDTPTPIPKPVSDTRIQLPRPNPEHPSVIRLPPRVRQIPNYRVYNKFDFVNCSPVNQDAWSGIVLEDNGALLTVHKISREFFQEEYVYLEMLVDIDSHHLLHKEHISPLDPVEPSPVLWKKYRELLKSRLECKRVWDEIDDLNVEHVWEGSEHTPKRNKNL